MKPFFAGLLTLALGLGLALPAEAHIVYFKDGTSARGTVTVKETSVTVTGGDAELSFPLGSVRAISFSDEPIAYEQRRVEESRYLNNDALIWTAVGVNVVTILAAAATFLRPAPAAQP